MEEASNHAVQPLTRRQMLGGMGAVAGSALLVACQRAAPTGSAPVAPAPVSPAGLSGQAMQVWNETLAAARLEGEVHIYGAQAGGIGIRALAEPFESSYPGIKVNGTFAPSNDLVPRLVAEHDAKKFIADVVVGPATQSVFVLKPAGVLGPLEPALLLPEVTDPSVWLDNKLWWIDSTLPYTTLRFQGYITATVTYNTQQVDVKQFTSFKDLLAPKWKGKFVANDIRQPGRGGNQVRFVYDHPDLGPGFLERLIGDQEVVFSNDQRQMIDWLAQGRYLLGLWVSSTQLKVAVDQGLPVAELPGLTFKEGAPVGAGGGTVNIVANAPHPNAAKVFINWILSRDGQINWQETVQQPSLRQDIPRGDLEAAIIPLQDKPHTDGGTEEFFTRISDDDIRAVVEKALDRRSPPSS